MPRSASIPSSQAGSPRTRHRTPGGLEHDPRLARRVVRAPAASVGDAELPQGWHLVALEHATDAIVVADLDGAVRYANPAFERDPGALGALVLGQDLRRLGLEPSVTSGDGPAAAIGRGDVWTGELVNRRPDGTLTHAEATVAPIRDGDGAVVGSVAVTRDVTRQRALETRLDHYRRERGALADAFSLLRAGETAEATAEVIGRALLGLAGLGGVGVFALETDGDVVPLAILDRAGRPVELPGRAVPPDRAAYLRERASHGPWIEDWDPRPDHPYAEIGRELELRVLAYVPIRSDGDAVGLLVVSAADGNALDHAERLPALVECAALAGALIGPQIRARRTHSACATRIRAIVADRAFIPVFQPIVELATRLTVGYEALTRFADGSRPDEVFAEAGRCGLALELEGATLEAILDASGPLPANVWLNLNVSAELILAGEPLASILRRAGWQVVLELTEHVEVTDYPALRAALERLGPSVRLAVDDAGAGFASLRHILELRPDYVKLDRGIVHKIHQDPARQALVAGMVHFAANTGAILVAEGVETEAEARELRELGVTLAQGYRLGRPALAGRLAVPLSNVTPLVGRVPGGHRPRSATSRPPSDSIGHAVNIGSTLAAALRAVDVATAADLRSLGAIPAWERLRRTQPRLATAATLLQLEGASRGIRISQLTPADRARLRLFVRLGRQAS